MTDGMLHEQPHRDEEVLGPSERSCGLTFGGCFVLVTALSWWRSGEPYLGLCRPGRCVRRREPRAPAVLRPLNRVWLCLGLLLHRIVNPLVMAAMCFVLVTPLGFLMRTFWAGGFGHRLDPARPSYWHVHEDGEPMTTTMSRQFWEGQTQEVNSLTSSGQVTSE